MSVQRFKDHLGAGALLSPQDGLPYQTRNPDSTNPILLICEHASNRVPARLGDLGLDAAQRKSHIAWDPGASELARALSETLDATLIEARFSRLVYDCNRPPEAISAMPHDTEVCHVAGNAAIDAEERLARTQEIYVPFHAEIAHILATKRAMGIVPILVSIHTFTPVFHQVAREVQIGFLHGDDTRLADAMLAHTKAHGAYDVRLNEPYAPTDGVLHLMEKHLDDTRALHVMIEVRNDLLAAQHHFQTISNLLAEGLSRALAGLDNASLTLQAGTTR